MAEPAPPPAPQVAIERIYLRDLSFESPQVPEAFGSEWTPQVKLDLNSGARRLDEGRFEVVLTLTLALGESSGGTTLLVVEVQQAGIFRIEGMDEATLAHALAVTCPTVLFPYARETVDALATKGNFPPFMLAPVNFETIHVESKRRAAEGPDAGVSVQPPDLDG